jgi:broad specificity phosphatase PhoE
VSALIVPSRSFLCLRHGATDWNRQGRFQGRTDNPLNDTGIAQAHAAAEKLRAVELGHVVSSPLLRAVQTAEIIANVASKTVTLDQGLIELDFGSFFRAVGRRRKTRAMVCRPMARPPSAR